MLGAIIGDMVGSIYDFKPIKTKDFEIYDYNMRMTDDSFLTIAVAKVLMNNYPIIYKKKNYVMNLLKHGNQIKELDLEPCFIYGVKKLNIKKLNPIIH